MTHYENIERVLNLWERSVNTHEDIANEMNRLIEWLQEARRQGEDGELEDQ